MSDFTLEFDVPEDARPARDRSLRAVSTGLAPTAAVPKQRGPDRPPCYVPCEACGVLVLTGVTPAGTRLALDTHIKTYTVQWGSGAAQPLLHESRAYPVHQCRPVQESSPGFCRNFYLRRFEISSSSLSNSAS
jgi:hypothetical protein